MILSIDTAATACSVALARGGAVIASVTESMARGQDARLLPLILETLAAAGSSLAELERIAVLRGPGSFTGIRIGLAAARGLGLARDIPVLGVNRFDLHRRALSPARDLLVVIDSRRTELFCRFYPQGKEPGEPFIATAAQLATYDTPDVAVAGDAAPALGFTQAVLLALPQSEAAEAALMAAALDADDPAYRPMPFYLRPPDVSCGPTPPAEEMAS